MRRAHVATVAEELERLRRTAADGILQPRAVVEAARDPESPLHPEFEWDDTDAAEKWRLYQARNLINVVVRYVDAGHGKQIACRVYASLTSDRQGEGGYRLVTDVLADSALRQQLLADARADMKRFRDKYRDLEELADVFEAMEATEQEAVTA